MIRRRGQYDLGRKSIYMILVIFFVTIMFIYINSTFGKFDLRILESTQAISSKVLMNQMVYSPHCFADVDGDTGRALPGIVDMTKFTKDRIYSVCGKYYKDRFSVYLFKGDKNKLRYLGGFKGDTAKKRLGGAVKGLGRTDVIFDNYLGRYVLIKDGDKLEKGVIVIGF